MEARREHWGTRIGIILAVAGSAVGLGNFLRFPGLAAKYGGGAFMVPYFISFLILGIPICWCEWTLGRRGGALGYNSSPGIFRSICGFRGSEYFGVIAMAIPLVIYMYYVYIESWCLAYAYYYLTGALSLGREPAQYKEFFSEFVGMSSDGALFEHLIAGRGFALYFLGATFLVNFYLIYRGLTRGIEQFCKFAMPVLVLAAIVVLVRVLTLGTPNPALPEQNVINGLGFMWNPKIAEGETFWSVLNPIHNPEMWLEASGQIFFSLSVGFGIVLTYASYLRRHDDVVLSGLTASATNEFCEVCLGGLITVPAAFIFLGADPVSEVAGSTLGLGFLTLPAVFEYMPLGRLFGFLWFFLLFLAAVTSSISMLQPVIAFIEEGFNVNRKVSAALLGLITAMGSLIVTFFSAGLLALDTMDFWVGSVLIFVLATVEVIIFGWVFGVDRGLQEAHQGALLRIPGVFRFIIKYVSPVYLLIIFGLFVWSLRAVEEKKARLAAVSSSPAAVFTLLFMAILIGFLAVLVSLAVARWQSSERDRRPANGGAS